MSLMTCVCAHMLHASFYSVPCTLVGTWGRLGCARHDGARHAVMLVGPLRSTEIKSQVENGQLSSTMVKWHRL